MLVISNSGSFFGYFIGMVYHSTASATTLVGESLGHNVLPIPQTPFPESLSHIANSTSSAEGSTTDSAKLF